MSNYGATELFVSNFVGIQEELGQLFGAHGSVQEFWISQQKKGVKPQPGVQGLYGVVRMATHEEACMARKALNSTAVNGKVLSVRWAANSRVLWVGQLGPGVTNSVLEAAFVQFGPVAKAVVVCETHTNSSRRFGFVAFEKKEDCQRAFAMCGKNMFLIGDSARPVIVEMARTEDADEGFTEEEGKRGHGLEGKAPPLGLPAHFALEGTAEHSIAQQLRGAQAQYKEARVQLKRDLQAAEAALLRGVAPSTLALQPALRLPFVPSAGTGAGGAAAPWLGGAADGGHEQAHGSPSSPPWQRERRRSRSPPRHHSPQRRQEQFHHVAPPRRMRGARDYSENRYNPRMAETVLPPDVAAAAAASAAPRSSGSFVRGGQLGTDIKGGTAKPQSPGQHAQPPPPPVDAPSSAPLLPGAKPLGSHDHGGIGFSQQSPAAGPSSYPPPSNVYQPGQAPPAASSYMNGGPPHTSHSYAPPPAPAQSLPTPNPMTGYPPPQGPAPPSGPPPLHYQAAQPQYAQQSWGAAVPQAHFGGAAPQSQGMFAGMQAGYGMQPPMQQYSAAPSYRPPGGGRGGGRGFVRGRG